MLNLLTLAWAAAFTVPADSTIPTGPTGEQIRYGRRLVTQTQAVLKNHSGNGLNCTSCHLNGGTTSFAAPWVGIWGVFPEYRARSGRFISLPERINDCFERSLNGKALGQSSSEMLAILSYFSWLSQGVPTGQSVPGRGFAWIKPTRKPDRALGQRLFAEKCASCHGADGQGLTGPAGTYLFPALWGPQSFNIAAGMARLNTAAAFIKTNMPKGLEGTLTEQEAFDLADYFTTQPRPDFKGKQNDWPRGDKPVDARY